MSTTADDALFPLEPQAGNTAPLPTHTRTVSGWGRTSPSTGEVLSTSDPELIADAVKQVAEQNASIGERCLPRREPH